MKPDELMARATASGIDLITTFQESVPAGKERELQAYTGPRPKQTRVLRHPEWTAHDAGQAAGHAGLSDHLYAAFAFRYAGDESQRKPLKMALMVRTAEFAKRDNWKRIRTCAGCQGTGFTHEIIYDDVVDQKTRQVKRKARGKPGAWQTRPFTCAICKSFGTTEMRLSEFEKLGLPPGSPYVFDERGDVMRRAVGQVFVLEQLVDLAIFEEWLTVHYVTGLVQLARDRCWAGLIGIEQPDWEKTVINQYRRVQTELDTWCGTAYDLMEDWCRDDERVA
jgi:hypothetical protein